MAGGFASNIDDKLWSVSQSLDFDPDSYATGKVAGLCVNGLINWTLNGKTLKMIDKEKAEVEVK